MGSVVAGSNSRERAIEMSLDGADWQTSDGGDLGELKLVQEAQQKDVPLAFGELGNALPYQGQLLVGDQARLQRAVAVRDVRRNIRDIDSGLGHALPEAKAVGPGMVADEIQGNPHQPRRDGAVAAEAGAGVPCPQKSILRERLGNVAVADGDQVKAE